MSQTGAPPTLLIGEKGLFHSILLYPRIKYDAMDYSPYYCKNFYKDRRKKAEETSGGAQNVQDCPALPPPRRPVENGSAPEIGGYSPGKVYRGRRRGKVFFSFLLLLLCFAIVFVSADMFSGGAVLDSLEETFGSERLETYYFVAKGVYSQKNRAETEAVAARENGGAGYLYHTGSGYYVVMYCHETKKTAELAKNTDSSLEIIEIRTRKPEEDGLSEAQKKLCGEALDLITVDIKTLYGIIASLSAGAIGREAALDTLSAMRNDLLYKKEELLNAGIAVDNAYLNLIEPLFGGLDAIVVNEPKEYFTQAVRYVQIGAILAFPR